MNGTVPSNEGPTTNWTTRSLLFFLSSRIAVFLTRLILFSVVKPRKSMKSSNRIRLLIGAGEKGWDLIEYQEIHASASEFLGFSNVARVSFSKDSSMLSQLRKAFDEEVPTHYFFDPRSGSQDWFAAIWEALSVASLMEVRGITPICALTDFPVRRWRLQSAIVSARRGVVTCLMSPRIVGRFFPHSRIIGPMPFPLSVKTLKALEALRNRPITDQSEPRPDVVFVGLLYEPRKSMIEAIQRGLSERGIAMQVIGRSLDGKRISTESYWGILASAKVVVATSSQISGKHTDIDGHNHLVYKFVEATAAGATLAIEPVDYSDHLFQPDVDYISYSTPEEATTKISAALLDSQELRKIAQRGQDTCSQLVTDHFYWKSVMAAT